MNKQKLLVIIVLSIFCVGMLMSSVTASHTFKAGKYKAKISDKKYNKLKKDAKKGKYVSVNLKTNQYKTYKEPKYKTKKVIKYKWKYKHVVSAEDWWSSDWSDYTNENYNTFDKYTNKGWTWYGNYYKTYDNGHHTKYYEKFKKKVKIIEKKKVKSGYKKVKKPVYITVSNSDITGKLSKKVFVSDVWTDYERLDI